MPSLSNGFCWFAEDKQDTREATDEPDSGRVRTAGVSRLIDCLDNYRKEWDPRMGVYRDQPRHDWASHGAKAFETLARCSIFESTAGKIPGTQTTANTDRGRRNWSAHT